MNLSFYERTHGTLDAERAVSSKTDRDVQRAGRSSSILPPSFKYFDCTDECHKDRTLSARGICKFIFVLFECNGCFSGGLDSKTIIYLNCF